MDAELIGLHLSVPGAEQVLAVRRWMPKGEFILKDALLSFRGIRKPAIIACEVILENSLPFRCTLSMPIEAALESVQNVQESENTICRTRDERMTTERLEATYSKAQMRAPDSTHGLHLLPGSYWRRRGSEGSFQFVHRPMISYINRPIRPGITFPCDLDGRELP